MNNSLLTEIDELYMWQTLMNDTDITYHLPLLFDELVKNGVRERNQTEREKNKTVIDANRNTNDKLTG